MRIELWHKGRQVAHRDLPDGIYRIGRADDSDIRIVSLQVSKNHALLAINGETVVIADQGSSNGIFVNGTKVKKHRILPGDSVVLADFTLKIGATEVEPIRLAS